MTRTIRTLALPLLLSLAACGGNDTAAESERKTAAGEVLGGSISDDMIPLDTVTSQSPPLRESADGDSGGTAGSAKKASDTAKADEPAEAPAEDTDAPAE